MHGRKRLPSRIHLLLRRSTYGEMRSGVWADFRMRKGLSQGRWISTVLLGWRRQPEVWFVRYLGSRMRRILIC